MRKKLISIMMIIFVMATMFTGCGKKDEAKPTDSTGTTGSTTEGTNDGTADSSGELTELTMFSCDVNPSYDEWKSPVAQKLQEKTGVKFSVEFPVGDVKERIGIMIASGEYPDLIYGKQEEMAMLVEAGAYIDLTDLIEEHAPNLKALYGEYLPRLKYSKADPSIYAISASPVNEARYEITGGFELQHAVVQELGYPKLETVKDYENAIKQYIEKHPTIDGQPTIGISLVADDWRWLISLGNPGGTSTGAPDDGNWYIDPVTYEAKYRFTRPEEKEYYRWLNHMYNEGLLDPDSFVQKWDAYIAKVASGRVLGLIDAKWDYQEGENVLKSEGKFERTYGQYPVQVDNTTKNSELRNYGYLAGYGIGISVNCKDPVKAIKFLDYMASEEGQILRLWGIEGVNYTVEDGKRVISPEEWDRRVNDQSNYSKETGVIQYHYPYPSYGKGVLDSTGNPFNPDTEEGIIKKYSDVEKEVLAAYGATMWRDLFPQPDELPESAWGAAFLINIPTDTGIPVTLQQCDDAMKAGLIEAIIASEDEFDGIWDRIMQELKDLGVEEMNAKYTELVKAQVEAWKE